MKFKFTTLLIAVMSFMAITTYGQQGVKPVGSNNGFENWENYTVIVDGFPPLADEKSFDFSRPVQWFGSDSTIGSFVNLAVLGGVTLSPVPQIFQSSSAHTGSFSTKISSENIGSVGVQPGMLSNSPIGIDLASALALFQSGQLDKILTAMDFKGGEPVTEQVARVYAWLKAGDVAVDNYTVTALATKTVRNAANTADSLAILGTGRLVVNPVDIQDWTQVSVDIDYGTNEKDPQNLVVIFQSSETGDGLTVTEGNSLLVDDVTFLYESDRALPIDDIHAAVSLNNNNATITWNASIKDNIASYVVQHSLNGTDWFDVSDPLDQLANNQYKITQYNLEAGNHLYRIKALLLDGGTDYSDVLRADVKATSNIRVWPNPATSGQVHISGLPQGAGVSIYNASGRQVLQSNNSNARTDIDVSGWAKGVYFLRVADAAGRRVFSTQIVKQ